MLVLRLPGRTARLLPRLTQPCRTFFPLPDLSRFDPFSGNSGGSGDRDIHKYHEQKILPYSQKQLWDVVADVDSYRHFLPFCKASNVLTQVPSTKRLGHPYSVNAELTVGFLALEESYVSKVTCTPFETVQATGRSHLFKSLTTTWRFQPAPHRSARSPPPLPSSQGDGLRDEDGPTLLTIDLEYAFASPLHAGIASKFFDQVSHMMVSAFEKRCLEVYGPGKK